MPRRYSTTIISAEVVISFTAWSLSFDAWYYCVIIIPRDDINKVCLSPWYPYVSSFPDFDDHNMYVRTYVQIMYIRYDQEMAFQSNFQSLQSGFLKLSRRDWNETREKRLVGALKDLRPSNFRKVGTYVCSLLSAPKTLTHSELIIHNPR